ncbi:uncharacterized protein DUF4129 [Antricoccus suffuscus]|uniref:Uncharacterized protein DUF4129 n=1 Tax=Antricoccus suffuscus TaxID=1629062 RepID=A0A2T1A4D8_9ACTN|nr:DUF4129 domain-containing protein [Antricoccus suffuscus]PRZ43459.1 uncharacterized protein DUF4129 [Antricoccus suffuscus]
MPRNSTSVVRAVAIGLAAAVLVVLVMVSTGGQIDLVHAPAHTTAAAAQSSMAGPPAGSVQPNATDQSMTGFWTGLVLLGGFVIVGLLALLLNLRKMVGGRRRAVRMRVEDHDDRLLDAVAEDASAHLAALRLGSPREAIIGCWLSLESTMQRVGLKPDKAETSTELVQRVLSTYPVERTSIERLAAAYREARFSAHDIPEASRLLALSAIERLHAELSELRRRGVPVPADGGRR